MTLSIHLSWRCLRVFKLITLIMLFFSMIGLWSIEGAAEEEADETAETIREELDERSEEDETDIFEEESTQDYSSGQFTQPEEQEDEIESPNSSLEGFELISENEYLELYVESETLALKVRNKQMDYIWSSTLDNIEEENLNETWQQFVRSAVSINHINQRDQERTEYVTEENTQIDLQINGNGFAASIVFPSDITMDLVVELQEDTVLISVPEESIQETEDMRLTSLNIYPFFGSVKEDEVPGYLFIPDGSGGLVRFEDQSTRMDYPYNARVYGVDQGFTTGRSSTDSNAPMIASLPVFGMVHGVHQNAMLAIIESGEEYSQLTAYKAGLATDFNWMTAEFIFRSPYRQPTNRSGTSAVDQYQSDPNPVDISLRYQFLAEERADYVGMALGYQDYLVENNILSSIEESNPLMRVEFLGGEREKGLFWDSVVTMTPITDVPSHIQELKQSGVEDTFVVYKGWYDGGLTSDLPNKFPFERSLGSKQDVQETIDQLQTEEVDIYFQTDYTRAFRRPRGIEYNQFVEQINTSDLNLTQGDSSYSYLLPIGAKEILEQDINEYEDYGMNNFALETTPRVLYSSHNRGASFSRTENKELVHELTEQLNDYSDNQTALYQPNPYLWDTTDKYLDIPMGTSNYLFVTDTVPFLQIVLKGYMDFYAPFSNFSSNQQDDLLKMIEYGAYPSFYLTTEDPYLLRNTDSTHLYTSQFENWKDEAIRQYEEIQEVTELVGHASVTEREVIEIGVVKVAYSNGTVVLVNYTDEPVETEGRTVSEKDFIVWNGGE